MGRIVGGETRGAPDNEGVRAETWGRVRFEQRLGVGGGGCADCWGRTGPERGSWGRKEERKPQQPAGEGSVLFAEGARVGVLCGVQLWSDSRI